MIARSLFRNLLEQLDVETARRNSFLNWHARGFDYLCLHRSPGLTVKVYMNRPGELVTCGNADYLVNPHDHAYNFDTHVVHGVVTNVLFRAKRLGEYSLWDYDPASRGANGTAGTWDLKETHRLTYRAGSGYSMAADEIHTIEVRRDEPVCMLLLQYESTARQTRLFTNDGKPPWIADLYSKPSKSETQRLLDRALTFAGAL